MPRRGLHRNHGHRFTFCTDFSQWRVRHVGDGTRRFPQNTLDASCRRRRPGRYRRHEAWGRAYPFHVDHPNRHYIDWHFEWYCAAKPKPSNGTAGNSRFWTWTGAASTRLRPARLMPWLNKQPCLYKPKALDMTTILGRRCGGLRRCRQGPGPAIRAGITKQSTVFCLSLSILEFHSW